VMRSSQEALNKIWTGESGHVTTRNGLLCGTDTIPLPNESRKL
jgi:hypothetical protein